MRSRSGESATGTWAGTADERWYYSATQLLHSAVTRNTCAGNELSASQDLATSATQSPRTGQGPAFDSAAPQLSSTSPDSPHLAHHGSRPTCLKPSALFGSSYLLSIPCQSRATLSIVRSKNVTPPQTSWSYALALTVSLSLPRIRFFHFNTSLSVQLALLVVHRIILGTANPCQSVTRQQRLHARPADAGLTDPASPTCISPRNNFHRPTQHEHMLAIGRHRLFRICDPVWSPALLARDASLLPLRARLPPIHPPTDPGTVSPYNEGQSRSTRRPDILTDI